MSAMFRRLGIDPGRDVVPRVKSSMVTATPKNPSGLSGVVTDNGPKRNGPKSILAAIIAAIAPATITSAIRMNFKVL